MHFSVKSVKRFVRFFELAQFGTRVSSFWFMSYPIVLHDIADLGSKIWHYLDLNRTNFISTMNFMFALFSAT